MFQKLFHRQPSDDLNVQEVFELRNGETELVVIDVRELNEFVEGHVAGATLLPLGQVSLKLNEIPHDTPVAMICRSGSRSGIAVNFLKKQGFTNVRNVRGGMNAWERAGLPVERGR